MLLEMVDPADSRKTVQLGPSNPLQVGGLSAVVGASFLRPTNTTPYDIGDLIADTTVAASITPAALGLARANGGTGVIRRVRLSTSKVMAGTEIIRVHFFKLSPTVDNGDNGPLVVNGVAAVHLGYVDVTLDRVFKDGSKGIGVPAAGSEIMFDAGAATTNIFALLEARAAFTPASAQTFTLAVETMRD